MKKAMCFSFLSCLLSLLVLLNGAPGVEAKKKATSYTFHSYTLYIFGDSFADTGNIPKGEDLTQDSRVWYAPYGINRPLQKGRFSDGYVQTDVAVGIVMDNKYQIAPSTYRIAKRSGDPAGMNFAHAGAGVLEVGPDKQPTLARQIEFFRALTESGIIDTYQLLNSSVALVAISGNDYVCRR